MTGNTKNAARYNTAILYAYVAVGSVLGGLARYLMSLLIVPVAGFPLATLFVTSRSLSPNCDILDRSTLTSSWGLDLD